MSEKKEIYVLGEHYRFETSLFMGVGKLLGLTDSELVFGIPALKKGSWEIVYHDDTKSILAADMELIIGRGQMVRANLHEFA